MKKTFSFIHLLFLLLLPNLVLGAIKLPPILSSNMVLQRNTNCKLWGWANPNEAITITASWLPNQLKVKADIYGNWMIDVQTTNSKASQTIELKSKESTIKLENILFGEVWLCSGQSNMEQPVKGFNGQPTFESLETIVNANNSQLRLFSVLRHASKTPLQTLEKFETWQEATPQSVANFSAVAYFFGKELQKFLDVPVGLVYSAWGGSPVQTWMRKEVLESYQKVDLDTINVSKNSNRIPTVLYNAMIHPLHNFTIKGTIWYQGEGNRMEPEKYKELFPAMVKDWRAKWNIGDFPFYFVQIAPFTYNNNTAFQGKNNSAFIRETQLQCVDIIPNSGIAITLDLGEPNFIHPPRKKEVAFRLLVNALHNTYGFKAIDGASPVYTSHEIKANVMVLKFKNAETGLYAFNELKGFEIAGDDKVFYPAKAKIINQKEVLVESDQVANPVAVRYAWRNWVVGTLFDTNLLPASSFRTDVWDDATQADVKK